MIVKMQDTGRGVTGLRIGSRNVKTYFTKAVTTVDLDLESVQIRCDLSHDFWRDHPEIADPRLCAWLTAKNSSYKSDGRKLVLQMLPAGTNAFRILPVKSALVESGHSYSPAARTGPSLSAGRSARGLKRRAQIATDGLEGTIDLSPETFHRGHGSKRDKGYD